MIRPSCTCQLGRGQRLDAIDAFNLPDRSLAWQNPTSRNLHTIWDKFGGKPNLKYGRSQNLPCSACFSSTDFSDHLLGSDPTARAQRPLEYQEPGRVITRDLDPVG
jgi:hypothetical protein